jgi:hypothetical protein
MDTPMIKRSMKNLMNVESVLSRSIRNTSGKEISKRAANLNINRFLFSKV